MASCFQRFTLVLLILMSVTVLVKLAPFLKEQMRVQDSPAYTNYYEGYKSAFDGYNSGSDASPDNLRGSTLNAPDRDGKSDDGIKDSKGLDVDRYNDASDNEHNGTSSEELDNEDANGDTGDHHSGHDDTNTMESVVVNQPQSSSYANSAYHEEQSDVLATAPLPEHYPRQINSEVSHSSSPRTTGSPPPYQDQSGMPDNEYWRNVLFRIPQYGDGEEGNDQLHGWPVLGGSPPQYTITTRPSDAGNMDWIRRFQKCVFKNFGWQLDPEHPYDIVKCGVCSGVYLAGCPSASYVGYMYLGWVGCAASGSLVNLCCCIKSYCQRTTN